MVVKKLINYSLNARQLFILEVIIIIGFSLVPLFANFPYRINIFLAWEGAYRLYSGQVPFKDFGMPLGFGFWIIPALFFKIFGPYLFTLIKAQAFINIVAGFTFSSILNKFKIHPPVKFLAVTIFVLSYSFVNFWPWYNHMVFVYQLLSINFLLVAAFNIKYSKWKYASLALSALFLFLSLFTKQDGGGLAFLVNFFMLLYFAYISKDLKLILTYYILFIIITAAFLIPLLRYDFLYWFNYGQDPHSSRTVIMDFLNNIFIGSQWIKFYLLLILLITFTVKNFKEYFYSKEQFGFALLVTGILVQALLVQTTSYIPFNVNIYFHSFALAFVLSFFAKFSNVSFSKIISIAVLMFGIIFWWSFDYWKYGQRIITKVFPALVKEPAEGGVSINTWIVTPDTVKTSREDWITTDLKSFEHVYMPPETVKGINYLTALPVVKEKANKNLKVLNMSELTPLAHELGFELEKGTQVPLWYHKNVAIFDKQIQAYCSKIENQYYDLVLFEHINYLNNFYPDEVRECLKKNYNMDYKFLAPREIQNSYIEVYLPKK